MKEKTPMDRISQLPDHLLLKVLSFLPTTRDVVTTMVLSKRWEFLWSLVPRLVYDDRNWNITNFSRFVDRSLLLHEALVLDYLQFNFVQKSSALNIEVWAKAVARRHVRELVIKIDRSSCIAPAILPKSLSRMLVTLELNNMVLVDVSTPVSFSFLKKLSLDSIKYPGGEESVNRLLSNCPVLERLFVVRCPSDNVARFTVRVPSLKIFSFSDSPDEEGVVIDTPSLETLTIDYSTAVFFVFENEMPNIATVDIDIFHRQSWNILTSITPVKVLCLCLTLEDSYPSGCVFHRLVDFKLCRCDMQWLNVLMCVLRDSPKLRTLKLDQVHGNQADQPCPCWSEPSLIPECLLSSLETLEWGDYEGTKEEKEVMEFILRNGSCLKKVTISFKSTEPDKKLEMCKELTLSSRRSLICQLEFV